MAAVRRQRAWLRRPDIQAVLDLVAVGLVMTVGLEWHATELQNRWQYGERMPTLPLLGTGLAPLLQGSSCRRQLLGQEALTGREGLWR